MEQLAQVYKLPLSNLHVFCDTGGGLIAFNRNGSIFLNVRYFEEWRKQEFPTAVQGVTDWISFPDDQDASQGNSNAALVSWYFTIAHEIAHNLVQPHNSEHEFYFSAISEHHLMSLRKVLQPE